MLSTGHATKKQLLTVTDKRRQAMKKVKCLLLIIVLVVASVSVYQPAYSKANFTVNKKALKKMAA